MQTDQWRVAVKLLLGIAAIWAVAYLLYYFGFVRPIEQKYGSFPPPQWNTGQKPDSQ